MDLMILGRPPLVWILAAILIVSSSSLNNIIVAGFDLNMEPTDEGMSEAPATNVAGSSSSSPPTQQSSQKVAAFYAKIQKLFKVLEICDTNNLDFATLQVPNDFSAQSKAMMVLKKVAKSNLIPKKDKGRYERIMENCSKINDMINSIKESSMSLDSQTSGGDYEDRLARLEYEMKNSVLDGLKDRFARMEISKVAESPRAPIASASTGFRESSRFNKPPVVQEKTPVARLETEPMDIQTDHSGGGDNRFFTFL